MGIRMSIDIRRLRYFLVLSEELHFRRAAERLGITQAPLSLAIQMLERELGAQLFHRTQRRVSLTEIGAAFRDHASTIVGQLEHAVEDIHAMATGEAGYLRIGRSEEHTSELQPLMPNSYAVFCLKTKKDK